MSDYNTDAYDGYSVTNDNLIEGIIGKYLNCGYPVMSYLYNKLVVEKRSEAVEWVWWASCTSSKCNHHYDWGYFKEDPEWAVTKE